MRGNRPRLLDISEAILRIERYVALGRARFDQDELIQTWVIHHLQIVGGAARALAPEFRAAHPTIPWSAIIGMRTILVHQYFSMDFDAVWLAASRDAPALRIEVDRILESLADD